MRRQFLEGADVVATALADPRVAGAWDDPSVLDRRTIGSLAAHLARSGVWAVDTLLDSNAPEGPVDFEIAAQYVAAVAGGALHEKQLTDQREDETLAGRGPAALAPELAARLGKLRQRLPEVSPDRRVEVGGGRIMRLDDYLWTRIVEQVVHLDDLALSLEIEPWEHPRDAVQLVVVCGAEARRLRHGDGAVLRLLYRSEPAERTA